MNTNILKDFFCDLCSLQFDKKYVYDVHMRLVHKKTSTESPQSEIDKIAVKKEYEDLTKDKEKKPHKCSICDYNCKSKTNLKTHFDAVHEGKKPHKCSICDYSCTTKAILKIHINAVHEKRNHINVRFLIAASQQILT